MLVSTHICSMRICMCFACVFANVFAFICEYSEKQIQIFAFVVFFIKFLKNWSLFALFYIDQFLRDKGVILSKAKNENKLTVSKKFN